MDVYRQSINIFVVYNYKLPCYSDVLLLYSRAFMKGAKVERSLTTA